MIFTSRHKQSPHRLTVPHTPKNTVKRMGRPTAHLNWKIRYVPEGIHISQPDHIDSVVTLLA